MRNAVRKSRKLFISSNVNGYSYVFLNRVARIGLVACLLSIPAAAQQPDDLNAKFQAMEQRIKALESEVSALKAAPVTSRRPRKPCPGSRPCAPT